MCLVAKGKSILGEYRIDVHHEAWSMAKYECQLDVAYTVDIFLGENGPRIGEFNSFSSSGLYNCDLDIIVNEISKASLNEWN
jgi:hypothetical protein